MRNQQSKHISTTPPRYISLSQTGIALLFLVLGGQTRTVRVRHGCTIVLAQSFKQGCLKSAALSRYARMHKDSHTKPLHDATALMAVDAQMWQPKRLTRHDAKPTEQARRARMHDSGRTESLQGRSDPNDRKRKDA